MKVARSLAELPPGTAPSVVTVGNFDGVHCGHRMVIAQVIARAHELGARSVAVTFDPHPAHVLRPSERLPLITPLPQRLELLEQTGIDLVLVLPFAELRDWSAREFAGRVLCDALHAAEVHEGETFRFGHNAETGIEGLSQLGHEFCFTVRTYQPYMLRGGAVSSSRIRSLISTGNVDHARALLGRPFSVRGTPASGRGYGTRYTVPTVNLAPYTDLLPGNSVYITTLHVGEADSARTFRGVTNCGNRPTFGADSFAVETHLLDFEPIDLSETTLLELTFLHRLRDEQRFASPEDLRAQIGVDVRRTQRYFQLADLLNVRLR